MLRAGGRRASCLLRIWGARPLSGAAAEAILPELDLGGKTYCVTGSTDGIGRTTALQLARHNATVLIHGRCGGGAEALHRAGGGCEAAC